MAVRIFILSTFAALAACSQQPQAEPANTVTAAPTIAVPAPTPSPVSSAMIETRSPGRPDALIAQVENENEQCRGGDGGVATMLACNRRQALLKKLQDGGWCWGGADIEADKQYVACKPGDKDYSPGAFDEPYYSNNEIAEAANGQ